MAITVDESGSLTADGTEQTIGTPASRHTGTFQLIVDLTNMAHGDVVELRIKHKRISTDAVKLDFIGTYGPAAPGGVHAICPPVPVPANCDFTATLKQVAGTNRAYPWAIYKYA